VPERWRWAVAPLVVAAASRLFSLAVVLAHSASADRVATAFRESDAGWYLGIAANGYHADPLRISPSGSPQHDFAFYPAWPLAMRAGSVLPGPVDVVGAILANVLFVLAAVVVWRVFATRFGERPATLGVALLAFAPAGYVFSLPYTESLFLLLAALSFALVGSWWRAPVGAAAMLTRVAGGAIVASALVEAVLARGRARHGAIAAIVGGGIALACWLGFVALLTGDPLGYTRGSPDWIQNGGVGQFAVALERPTVERGAWFVAYAVVVVGALLLVRRDRELAVYSLVALALPLLPGGALGSMPRYALVAFPAFAMLAERLGPRWGWVAVAASALVQVVFAGWVFAGDFHP
jgi:hypothetical protein